LQTQVIDFDDVLTYDNAPLPDYYAGYSWSDGLVVRPDAYPELGSSTSSEPNALYLNPGQLT
jgi:hypothetical protein